MITRACQSCGAENDVGSAFCLQCGAKLPSATPLVAASPTPTASAPATPTVDYGSQVYLTSEQYRTLLARLDTANDHLKSIRALVGVVVAAIFISVVLGIIVGLVASNDSDDSPYDRRVPLQVDE